jgi:TctA family transporter
MENIILALALLHFVLTFLGYGFLAWKVKQIKYRLNKLYVLVGALPIITSAFALALTFPHISTNAFISFFEAYIGGLVGGGIASSIITAIENPRRSSYKRTRYKKYRRYG